MFTSSCVKAILRSLSLYKICHVLNNTHICSPKTFSVGPGSRATATEQLSGTIFTEEKVLLNQAIAPPELAIRVNICNGVVRIVESEAFNFAT